MLGSHTTALESRPGGILECSADRAGHWEPGGLKRPEPSRPNHGRDRSPEMSTMEPLVDGTTGRSRHGNRESANESHDNQRIAANRNNRATSLSSNVFNGLTPYLVNRNQSPPKSVPPG